MGAVFVIIVALMILITSLITSIITYSHKMNDLTYKKNLKSAFRQEVVFQVVRENTIKEEDVLKENVEQSMITVCEILRENALKNGCYGNQVMGWEFLGCSGLGVVSCSGNLQDVMSGSVSSFFSCSDAGSYGRYLLRTSLSSFNLGSFSWGNFTYYVSYPSTTTDACGVADFLKIGS